MTGEVVGVGYVLRVPVGPDFVLLVSFHLVVSVNSQVADKLCLQRMAIVTKADVAKT